jgi:pilus assembly protein CpaC
VRLPSDGELFLFGKVAGKANTPEGEVARQDFNSAYGYVME